jgi:hypothetical protein
MALPALKYAFCRDAKDLGQNIGTSPVCRAVISCPKCHASAQGKWGKARRRGLVRGASFPQLAYSNRFSGFQPE